MTPEERSYFEVRPLAWGKFIAELEAMYESAAPRTARAMQYTYKLLSTLNVARHDEPPRSIETTADLTVLLVSRFLGSLNPDLSPFTIKKRLAELRAMCTYAESCRYIVVSPFKLRRMSRWIRVPQIVPGRRHLSREEIRRVLDRMRQDMSEKLGWAQWRSRRLFALTATVAFTGLRAGEAQRLHVADIDLADRIIRVVWRGKGLKTPGAEAPVGMPKALVPILADWIPHILDRPEGVEVPADVPWAFPGTSRLGPWTSGPDGHRPVSRLQAVARRAGVDGIDFVTLRRSWATHSEGQIPEALINRQLRNSPEVARRFYRRADTDNLRSAVEDFEI